MLARVAKEVYSIERIRSLQLDFDDEVAQKSVQWLYDYGRKTDAKPFFHTVSMSHPHDGFDPESGVDFEPLAGTVHFGLGQTSATVEIVPSGVTFRTRLLPASAI